MKRLIAAEAIVGLVSSLIFVIFPYQLINIFGAANESVYYTDFAVKCIRIFLCLLALSCVNKGTFIFLQSIGNVKQSTALSMIREIVFGVGLPLLLPIFWGLNGILYFMPLADILTFVASVVVIVRTRKVLSAPSAEGERAASSVPVPPESGAELTKYVITISRSYGAGRADLILKDNPNVLRIFITASTKTREQRIAERDQLSEANSRKKVARVDRERASYYNQYSDKKWGDAASYDLCVDTDKFGIDGTAEMLFEITQHDFIGSHHL